MIKHPNNDVLKNNNNLKLKMRQKFWVFTFFVCVKAKSTAIVSI